MKSFIAAALIVSSPLAMSASSSDVVFASTQALAKSTLSCTETIVRTGAIRSVNVKELYIYPAAEVISNTPNFIKIVSKKNVNDSDRVKIQVVTIIETSSDDMNIVSVNQTFSSVRGSLENTGTIRNPKYDSKEVVTVNSVVNCK